MEESTLYFNMIQNLNILKMNKERLKELNKIGSGGFASVKAGFYLSLPIAIKKLKNCNLKDFLREISLVKRFKHSYVPNLYGIIAKEDKDPVIITEIINGEHIDKYIKSKKASQLQILIHLLDIATVIEFFHSNKFIHRDLKPSNIMIDQTLNVKLLDFGISKVLDKTVTNTITMGTLIYMAPENFSVNSNEGQTMTETSRSSISTKVDIWAFGCIIAELFSGVKPWSGKEENQIIGMLYSKKKFEISKNIIDIDIILLIECCTRINPFERSDIMTVRKKLLKILFTKMSEQKSGMMSDINNNIQSKVLF